MGDRHHLYPNVARLALLSGRGPPLRPQGRGLVHEAHTGA